MRTIRVSVPLRVQPINLWKAITTHEALPHHTLFLRAVKVVEEKAGGVGTIRECTMRSGMSFTERITAWEEAGYIATAPTRPEFDFHSNAQRRVGALNPLEQVHGLDTVCATNPGQWSPIGSTTL
jgi:hypothetical protein